VSKYHSIKIVILLFTFSLSIFIQNISAHAFTRKLVVNYSDRDANNISHVVVTQQKNYIEWLGIEKPFSEVCAAGECIVEIDLDPESEYEFMVYFKNSVGNGRTVSCSFKTGKIEPVENNPPIINVTHSKISDSKVFFQGTVHDESHVELRIQGNKSILNSGYTDFNFEIDIQGSTNLILEAKDIHGNIRLLQRSGFIAEPNLNTSYRDYDGSDADIKSIQALVAQIYVATFDRAPDYSGLMYWTNTVETGLLTMNQVAQSFFDQTETQSKFPEGSSNAEFITTIYQNALSRAPEAEGLAYWAGALDRGAFRRDQAIMAIINGAKAEDADILAKKTEIGIYFATSEIGNLTGNKNFMDWARNVISFATSSDFNLKEAKEYIAYIVFNIE